MNMIKCGDILVSNGIEFSFACIKCENIYKSIPDYQMHILEEHIQEIFGENFNEFLEVAYTDTKSDSEAEDIFVESKSEELTNCSKSESSDATLIENSKDNVKLQFENILPFEEEYKYDTKLDTCQSDDHSDNDGKTDLESKESMFKCEVCNKIFDELTKYRKHKKRTKCGKCPLCNGNYGDIWSHISKFHKDYYHDRKKSGLAVFERASAYQLICEYCNRVFKKQRSFQEHIKIHLKSLDKCKFCGKRFKEKASLTTHIRTHTGEKPFKCPHCPVAFSDNANLKTHIITKHTEGLNAKCRFDNCDKTFKTKELRNRHERYVHEDKRDYLCLTCGMRFKTSSKLNVHVKTKHLEYDKRPFQCTICDKKYVFNRDYSHHMMIHTGERPHTCEFCLKTFITKKCLSKHKRSHLKKI